MRPFSLRLAVAERGAVGNDELVYDTAFAGRSIESLVDSICSLRVKAEFTILCFEKGSGSPMYI